MATAYDVQMGQVMRRITLDVRIVGAGVARFRLWVAAQIMKLAGLVAGCGIRVDIGNDFDDVPPLPRGRSYVMVGDIEIPAAASVRPNSPLYVSTVADWGRKVDFYLDGVRQEKVVSYDLDAGAVRVFRDGPDGQPFIAGDEIETEIRSGHLEARPSGLQTEI